MVNRMSRVFAACVFALPAVVVSDDSVSLMQTRAEVVGADLQDPQDPASQEAAPLGMCQDFTCTQDYLIKDDLPPNCQAVTCTLDECCDLFTTTTSTTTSTTPNVNKMCFSSCATQAGKWSKKCQLSRCEGCLDCKGLSLLATDAEIHEAASPWLFTHAEIQDAASQEPDASPEATDEASSEPLPDDGPEDLEETAFVAAATCEESTCGQDWIVKDNLPPACAATGCSRDECCDQFTTATTTTTSTTANHNKMCFSSCATQPHKWLKNCQTDRCGGCSECKQMLLQQQQQLQTDEVSLLQTRAELVESSEDQPQGGIESEQPSALSLIQTRVQLKKSDQQPPSDSLGNCAGYFCPEPWLLKDHVLDCQAAECTTEECCEEFTTTQPTSTSTTSEPKLCFHSCVEDNHGWKKICATPNCAGCEQCMELGN